MFLQTNSVWVKKHKNTTISKLLFNILQKENFIKWTKLKIKKYMAIGGEFNSGQITYFFKTNFTYTSTIKTPISTSLTTNPTLFIILFTQFILLAQQNQPHINLSTIIKLLKQN